MRHLLNQYAGKISYSSPLWAPPNEGQGGQGGAANDGQQSGDDDSDDGNGGGDDDDESDPDLKGLGLADILGESEDSDDIEFDIGEQDYEQTPEEKEVAQQLGQSIKDQLAGYQIDETDIPDDFDPNDRKSLTSLLGNTQRKAIASTLQMMVPVINHALGVASKQMKHHMQNSIGSSSAKVKATEGFKSLGLSDKNDIALGKTIFSRALKSNNNDVTKAVKSTRKAFSVLGKTLPNGPAARNGSQQSSKTRQGADALDDVFGKMT